jgi:hypothetical protein
MFKMISEGSANAPKLDEARIERASLFRCCPLDSACDHHGGAVETERLGWQMGMWYPRVGRVSVGVAQTRVRAKAVPVLA